MQSEFYRQRLPLGIHSFFSEEVIMYLRGWIFFWRNAKNTVVFHSLFIGSFEYGGATRSGVGVRFYAHAVVLNAGCQWSSDKLVIGKPICSDNVTLDNYSKQRSMCAFYLLLVMCVLRGLCPVLYEDVSESDYWNWIM